MRLGLPTPDRHTLPDVAAVGISAAMGAALARTVPPDSPVPAAVVLTACLLLSATLLWRRTHPMAVLWSAPQPRLRSNGGRQARLPRRTGGRALS
ncbi:hypothetical protein [Nocardiopsis sp. NPDC058789]|uniref:hypothetical protein n=1 Tax=Nocardiopsis TaxID=2013 RepID=UPI0036724DFE